MKSIWQTGLSFSIANLVFLTGLAELVALSGCANVPYVAGDTLGAKKTPELQTGSNLVRRNKADIDVREADKDAIESSLRGTNANRDKGR